MTTRRTGLREKKKTATRKALREAALRLALERGPENVRVDDIADAAGVSPRTYNNYFPGRDHAIVAAVTAERDARLAAAVTARAGDAPLADAVTDAIVEAYTEPGEADRDAMLMITTRPALREAYVDTVAAVEEPLAEAIAARSGADPRTAAVLAAATTAAVRVALREWLGGGPEASAGLLVPRGSLPEALREAMGVLRGAFEGVGRRAGSDIETRK